MKLQPLYDVKERLEQAAIAGTGLLGEDFRLTRAAEGLKPLAAASPVFGKIDGGLRALLAAPATERGGRLLDLLALVDAVAYTQGSTGMVGELEPLPSGGSAYHPISYGQLQPLLTALTSTGGGRMEIIQSSWEAHPQWFADFRVLPAVVAGLGDSYGEISELNAKILKGMGPSVLPLLKQDFDPAGKKEMVRRVEVISAIAGANATPWLLEVLSEAKKDVRAAVIIALGADPDNLPLLLDLSKTERGNSREAVLEALAKLDGETVAAFWTEELRKKPDSVKFLRDTDTQWAAALIASGLRQRLEGMLTHGDRITAEEQTEIVPWCGVINKKVSVPMLEFWHWAVEHMEEFDRFTSEKGNPVFMGVRLTDTLQESLRLTGPGPLCNFCLTLFDNRPAMTRYLISSFHAALLSYPAAEVFEKYSPYILTKKPILDVERKKSLNKVLLRALEKVSWNQKQGCYVLTGGQPISEPLDRRWFDLLFQVPDLDDTLRRLIPSDDLELHNKLEGYLYRKILDGGHFIQEDVAFLREHGWTQWKGFLDKKVRKDGSLTTYAVVRLLNETSLTGPEKAAELRNLFKIVQEQNALKKRPSWPEQRVRDQIAAWEAE